MFNCEALNKLIAICQANGDDYGLELICESLETFEEYHTAIYSMETKLKIMSSSGMEREDYQAMVQGMDKKRTMQHNRVLTAVNVLNRMAQKENLEPIYDGIVSEERPYRREVANAVLAYVENIIKSRR